MTTNSSPTLIAFGPVPSRRLGRSLGINNIPPKSCSYSCIYCQVGSTHHREITPRQFYKTEEIYKVVKEKIEIVRELGEQIDYLTFVPDGEPSLDALLSDTIECLKPLGFPIAVISNASLIWRADVQKALQQADWVSLKVDSVDETVWRKINQPHENLQLPAILEGIQQFSEKFQGEFTTETMLVNGINDHAEEIQKTAIFLGNLVPDISYISIPTRPPAQTIVQPPSEQRINQAFQIIAAQVKNTEYLIGYEGDVFAYTGDIEQDLLSITAVHPMREQAVQELLQKAGADWTVVQRMILDGKIKRVDFANKHFYIRCLQK
jgi:wyosine [tRNA(Phe)-imidazoG37] synthetase (radical SAM superfamily)